MSRVGKKPIQIPENVEIEISYNEVRVKGPKGEMTQSFPDSILVKKEENELIISPKRKGRDSAKWGLTRSLIYNAVLGVSKGFEKKLEIQGIGYKAASPSPDKLTLEVGYSHPVDMDAPEGIEVEATKNSITIKGVDKQKVGEFAAKVRKVRPPEPYKGKGIRYFGEEVRRKEGKKAVSSE